MPSHSLSKFTTKKYCQNKSTFKGVYLGNNLLKIKDESYVANLDGNKSLGTNWVALYVSDENVSFFDSFAVENIRKEIKKLIGTKIS